jgi:pyridinium-3,5-biscarboxylic acid mononucleotide sulfurtransferase
MDNKIKLLKGILSDMESVLIAFSAGTDSTFLCAVAREVLGERALAVTEVSELNPQKEAAEAQKLSKTLNLRHLLLEPHPLSNEVFCLNPPQRCYLCKKDLFSQLKDLAQKEGIKQVIDGTNYDDAQDFRPGMKALKELGIRSPLQEAKLTKQEIRDYSKELKLPTWNKDSSACLASRIPYGDIITGLKLKMIEQAESYLAEMGFTQLRVRYHNGIARIEVNNPLEVMERAAEISQKLKKLGFTYITLDLQGYRMGSLNEVLNEKRTDCKVA